MRVLMEQWEAMSSSGFVGRDTELRALVEALKRPGNITELVTPVGVGKTALLRKMVSDNTKTFDGAIEYFTGSPHFPLTEAVDVVAERFRAAPGHSLLIIDDADALDPGQTLEGIKRLESGPWRFSTVVASQRGLGLGTPMGLAPLDAEAFAELLRSAFDGDLDAATMERLWAATRGNPRLARILRDQWRAGRAPDVAALPALLSQWHAPGLVGWTDGHFALAARGNAVSSLTSVSSATLSCARSPIILALCSRCRRAALKNSSPSSWSAMDMQ